MTGALPIGGVSGARRLRWAAFGTYCAVALAYLAWRGAFTITPHHPVYGVVFYLAEIVGVATSMVFYLIVVERRERAVPDLPETPPSVDVLIATYDEDPDLLRATAIAARDMDLPHATWICDDGHRREVEALARELGVGYLERDGNEHYKAGNINHALSRTRGEVVLILDADHVPRSNLLRRLLGHFADPAVALVQIPQIYYNLDSYQHVVSPLTGEVWHEASIFHHLMQPGLDRLHAAFFVGTGALIRRRALDEIGGFATGSITEDIHTSMRLHAAGWRSVYVDEPLGFMQAADTAFAYARQRLRWAQGSMQILRRENPLFRRGLSWTQRIGYLNSLGGYLLAYQHLLFYLAPAIYLLGGPSPIALESGAAVPVFAGYICTALFLYRFLAGRHARLFLSECFKMLNLPLFILASAALLRPDGLVFRVTPKGAHKGWPTAMVAPLVPLVAVNLTAVGIGVAGLIRGNSARPEAVIFALIFATFFGISGTLALVHSFERRQTDDAKLPPVQVAATFVADGVHRPVPLKLRRLGHDRAYALVDEPPPLAARTAGRLQIPELQLERDIGAIYGGAHAVRVGGRRLTVLSFRLRDLDRSERDRMDRYCFEVALPRFFGATASDPIEHVNSEARSRRSRARNAGDPDYLPIESTLV
ncbi:MAG: glycosyltransferase family 2 protein [Candidatus Krumholzibacteriia bacterium]